MIRRLSIVALLALATAALALAARAAPPNIVILLADDLGYGELACQGNPQIPTPRIDFLARDGVRFTDAYVSAPVCSPSRAGLLTGRYQQRFGHEFNPIGDANQLPNVGLPLDQRTLADHLRAAGYATAGVGKWHLGGSPPFHPTRRGFDQFFGFLHEGHFYVPPTTAGVTSHLRPNEPDYDHLNPLIRGDQEVSEGGYLTDAIAREAVSFIDAHRAKPFFLYVAFNAVHSPMQATQKYYDRFSQIGEEHRRVFAAMLSALDDAVGAILDELHKADLDRDTLVIFLSDNGGPTEELTSSNLPLSGGKGQLLEGGIRIPFLMRWPGHVPAGKTDARPVISLDIVPTALAAAGAAPLPGAPKLDGVDLLGYLDGSHAGSPHDALYWRIGPQLAIRRGNDKLLRLKPKQPFQLFDLARDLAEKNDQSAAEPARAEELKRLLLDWDAQLVPPRWPPGGVAPAPRKK